VAQVTAPASPSSTCPATSRVDCYDFARRRLRRAGEVVLMDVAGMPLLTVR
jgi:hypothetical protein